MWRDEQALMAAYGDALYSFLSETKSSPLPSYSPFLNPFSPICTPLFFVLDRGHRYSTVRNEGQKKGGHVRGPLRTI